MIQPQDAVTPEPALRLDPRANHDDPLLDGLLSLCAFHQKPASRATLSAGLPLADHRLTPELLPRAAARERVALGPARVEPVMRRERPRGRRPIR